MTNQKKQQKLRIVFLYSSGHFGSTVILNHLLKKCPYVEVVGLVRSPAAKDRKKLFSYFRKLGLHFSALLFWQRLIQGFSLLLSGIVPLSRQRLTPGWLLCIRHSIPFIRCKEINDDTVISFIEGLEPDIIISAYFSHILRKPVLSIPRIGCLNIHPGYLPECRGAMNYFWAIVKDMKYGGVSIHWMDEGIDTGAIIARKRFSIPDHFTQQQVMIYSAVIGAKLLRRTFKYYAQTQGIPTIHDPRDNFNYFAVPSKNDFDHYIRRRRFFRFRDVIRFVFREIK